MFVKKFLFVFFVAIQFMANGQQNTPTLNVFQSQEFKEKEKTYSVYSFYRSKDEKTVVLRRSKKKFIIDLFDSEFSKTTTDFFKASKKEWFVGDLFYGNELKFFTVTSPKRSLRELYCHTYNLENRKYKKTKIYTKKIARGGSLFASRSRGESIFEVSPNGEYFTVAINNTRKKINSSTVLVYSAKDLSVIYEKSYQSHEEKEYVQSNLLIDDNKTVYSLGKIITGGKFFKRKKGKEKNYYFVLNKITQDKETEELEVKLEGKEQVRTLVLSKPGKDLNLIGFYSETKEGRIKGGCDFKVDTENLSIISKKINALPLEVYNDLYGEKRAVKKKKKGKELKDFYIDYILEDEEEGSTYLLAEEFYTTQTYVSTSTGGYWVTTPHYDNIIILKFNKSGDLDWGRSIYKQSVEPSYNAFIKDHQLHVILNTGKNLKEQSNGRVKLSRGLLGISGTALYDFAYASNGEVVRSKIQDNKGKRSAKYSPWLGEYQNGKFIMMTSSKRKKKFMILE